MKIKLFIAIGACVIFHSSFSQYTSSFQEKEKIMLQDSTLMKMVKGINEVVKARVKASFPPHSIAAYNDYVVLDKEGPIHIDSLYKYKMQDFKNISISFDEPAAIYGAKSEYGVIRLLRK